MRMIALAVSAAVFVLSASVGIAADCALVDPCGDVNGSGGITSADALAVLRKAVGQPVETVCAVTGSLQPGQLPETGQTTSYGPGSDGAVRAGVPRSFSDNGDGTITDNVTGLMWEKKSDDGSVHDWDNAYKWCSDVDADFECDDLSGAMDGPVVTEFLATLNSGGGFAGRG